MDDIHGKHFILHFAKDRMQSAVHSLKGLTAQYLGESTAPCWITRPVSHTVHVLHQDLVRFANTTTAMHMQNLVWIYLGDKLCFESIPYKDTNLYLNEDYN